MKEYLVIKMWRHVKPAFWGLVTILVVLLWPSIPLGGFAPWMRFLFVWFPQNILYILMSVLSGIYVGIFTYNRVVVATCPVTKSTKLGFFGSIGGILLGACPACIPVVAFLLPLSVSVYLSRISWVFLLLAVLFLAFIIYRMGGLKRI